MLSVWQATIVDESGNVQSGASVQVLLETTGAPAAVFSDRNGTLPTTNPLTTDTHGLVRFYAAGGSYRIDATRGAFTRTWRHVAIGLLGELDNLPESYIKYERTPAEIAAGVTPTNYAKLPGDPERYGTNTTPGTTDMSAALTAANAQAAQPGGAPIICNSVLHVPSKVTITGPFKTPRIRCFSVTSMVVFGPGTVEAILPEWWGAKADATANGASGTNCTLAVAAAIRATTENGDGDTVIHPFRWGSGNYLVGNMVIPAATDMRGNGRHITNLVVVPGTSGKWLVDAGNAAKIILADFAMYGNDEPGLTHGVQLGRGKQQHGTEGFIDSIWVRDCTGIQVEIDGNVGFYSRITTYGGTHGIVIAGVANMANHLAPYACSQIACDLSYTDVQGLEIEAPATGALPLYIRRNSKVTGLTISLASGTTLSHLIELDPEVSSWQIEHLQLLSKDPTTIINGNFKRGDGSFFGGNGTNGNKGGEGNYSSENFGLRRQAFRLRITNTGGTLQHRIAASDGSAAKLAGLINGASVTLTNTPSGPDASTPMVAGGKVGGSSPSYFWFDTPAQVTGYEDLQATVEVDQTGHFVTALPTLQSININGVTRIRLAIQFFSAATGTAFALNTTNIGVGKILQVAFSGSLSP